MLKIFKVLNGSMAEIHAIEPDCWVDLSDPTPSEINKARVEFGIPKEFLLDSLDLAERSRLQVIDEYIFMVVRASAHNSDDEIPFVTLPIGIIITPMAVVTVCRAPFLAESFIREHISGLHLRERMLIAMKLIQQVCIRYIEHLQIIDSITTSVEKAMREAMRNEELERMLHVEKTLVYFVTALKANGVILEKLQTSTTLHFNEEEKALLLDAVIECKQATEMADVYAQIMGSMSETFAAMISNNMNMVMKFLAGITLILMIPTIMVGFYGMNIPLPWQESRWMLPSLAILTVGICFFLWRYLVKKRWM